MDTINRLQFRNHEGIFETREDALEYICKTLPGPNGGEGLATPKSPYTRSLYAEPTILRYKNTEEEGTCETCNKGPHIILVIGSQTNDEELAPEKNTYCIIDIDKTEDEIKNLEEELEKAIKSLTLIVTDSSTLDLTVEKTEDGTILSGDVKTPPTHIFEGLLKENNLLTIPMGDLDGKEGLFIYVGLTYDEATETFTFAVSGLDENGKPVLKKQSVKLPNNYLTGGSYDIRDESIHLRMKNGEEILVDCKELIYEWEADPGTSTPIILNRERVKYEDLPHHRHADLLTADVRIDENRMNNILMKSINGRSLYVDGMASNIWYNWNGERSNVEEQLNKLNMIRISPDHNNILQDRTDGYYAEVSLDYVSAENKLIFKTTNVSGEITENEIQLNTVDIPIENIIYNPTTEELIILWKNDKGEIKRIVIPIGEMIQEWEVLNPGHNITLNKVHKVSGKDQLSADANIYGQEFDTPEQKDFNILEDRDHSLYVKGTADNIKYGNITVKDALDNLDDKIDAEIARSTEKDNEHDAEIAELSADTKASLKHVVNEDKSIDVVERDGEIGREAVIKVNLSTEVEDNRKNIIKLNSDGLFSNVDLNYIPEANKLIFHTSNGEPDKEIQLEGMSSIISIEYNPTKEAIIITYMTNGHEIKVVEIPVGDLINEWRVEDGHPHAVQLEKVRAASGTSEQDILKASVIITDDHDDNILVMDDGALYVPANTNVTEALREAIEAETERATEAEEALDDKIDAETIRAISAETALSGAISTVQTNLQNEIDRATAAETRIETKLDNEITRSTNKDEELYQLIIDEQTRATEADAVLDAKINTVSAESFARDAQLQALISGETEARTAQDTVISERLANEIARSTAEDQRLNDALQQEIADRQQGDADLEQQILDATLKFSPSKDSFESNGTIEFNNYETNNNIVEANVIVQSNEDNIIKVGNGIYATVHMSYDIATNKLKLTTSAGSEEFQLAGATVIDNLYYDNESGEIVITYHDGSGNVQTMKFPASELFNEWIVQNPSEKSAVELTKTPATEQGQPDTLSARALITDDRNGDGKPDEGSDNIIEIRNNGLYVCGSAMTEAQEVALCVKNEIKVFEKAVIGQIIGEECGSGYTYEPNNMATYIISANSFNNADFILDQNIKRIDEDIIEIKEDVECVDGKTDAMYKLLYTNAVPMPDCGEGLVYQPYQNACIISGATSFMEADQMLNDAICAILTMWVSGITCTNESEWVEDGANRKIEVHTRLSHGNGAAMTDEELTIETFAGDYIDPTNTEFTDTNALRIVCLTEGGGGTIPDIKSKNNGIYLSNVWDCGLYYGTTEEDLIAKSQAEAAGYNTNYSTDEDDSASGFNYMNNVRIGDDTLC
jgi:hypothetical protein